MSDETEIESDKDILRAIRYSLASINRQSAENTARLDAVGARLYRIEHRLEKVEREIEAMRQASYKHEFALRELVQLVEDTQSPFNGST